MKLIQCVIAGNEGIVAIYKFSAKSLISNEAKTRIVL